MKREVEREKKIPAFSIGVADLEVLWDRIISLFDKEEDVYGAIDINLPREKLEFKDVEELKQYSGFKGRITKFFALAIAKGKANIHSFKSILFLPSYRTRCFRN